jgi:DNA-binding NarL/FixJ family response regulator
LVVADGSGVAIGQNSTVGADAASEGLDRELASSLGVTRREGEVLGAVVARLSNAEIAPKLFISERTVESHVSALLRKLGATDRSELIERAQRGR